MIIHKVALGNNEEAFIEDTFSDGLNILLSDDNNKGKTIIIQSMLLEINPFFRTRLTIKILFIILNLNIIMKNIFL